MGCLAACRHGDFKRAPRLPAALVAVIAEQEIAAIRRAAAAAPGAICSLSKICLIRGGLASRNTSA
jgi:hypothetical protein